MPRNLILLFLIAISQITYGQNLDSLLKKAGKVYSTDPGKGIILAKEVYQAAQKRNLKGTVLKSLNSLSIMYWVSGDLKNAGIFAKTGLHLSESYKKDSLTGEFWNTLGLIDYSGNNYELAISKYENALHSFYKANMVPKIGITYLNLGISKKKLSRFDLANIDYFKAAAIFEKLGDTSNVSGIYNSLGNNFIALNNYKNAVKYYSKALQLSLTLKNNELIAQSYNNVGYAYTKQHLPDSAIKYLGKCLTLRQAGRDSGLMVLTLQNLGEAWKQKGEINRAVTYTRISIALAKKLDMKDELVRGNLDLAGLYLSRQEYAAAMKCANESELLAKKLNSDDLLLEVFNLRSAILEQTGDFKGALAYEKKGRALNARLFSIQKDKAVSELEVKYEVEQQTKSIAALHSNNLLVQKIVKQQKYFILALLTGSVSLIVLLVIAFKSYQRKRKDNQHIQNLMQELHHRVKNNLQILSGLFSLQLAESNDEKVRDSIWENEMRLNSMNLIHQKLYISETDSQINMKEYLEQLVQNIHISYREKSKNVSLIFDIEPMCIDADKALSVGLIVNELVTNAFKYAFNQENSKIYVNFKGMRNSTFLLEVKDNGKGINPDDASEKPASFGLKLVKIMAAQLNGSMVVKNEGGLSYQLELADLKQGTKRVIR